MIANAEHVRRVLSAALAGGVPVCMTAETTGVSSDDVITALSLKPLGSEAVTLYMPVPHDKEETAAKFLGLSVEDLARKPKVDYAGAADLLNRVLAACPAAGHIVPVTYNTQFQARFMQPLNMGDCLVAAPVDLTRIAWCLMYAPALPGALHEGMTLHDIGQVVDSMTYRVKGAGYRQVFPEWGIDLPDPLLPRHKPRLLEDLLLGVLGETDTAVLARSLSLPSSVPVVDMLAETICAHSSTTPSI